MKVTRPLVLQVLLAVCCLSVAAYLLPLLAQSAAGQAPAVQSPSASADRPSFEVASIKVNKSVGGLAMARFQPGGLYTASNVTTGSIITAAYQLKPHQLVGGPDWDRLLSEHFDIEAKATGNPSKEHENLMLQSLLADRFKLVAHHETRQLPVFALVLAKPGKLGPQLTPHVVDAKCIDITAGPPPLPPGPGQALPAFCGGVSNIAGAGRLHDTGNNVPMDRLVALLNGLVDRPVVDRTGLSGFFDFAFEFTRDLGPGSQPGATDSAPDPPAPLSIFTALQEQLGLKLESQTLPVDVLVIDHVEEPSPN
jgi:uncharacterized protein (TIGR03435 family)